MVLDNDYFCVGEADYMKFEFLNTIILIFLMSSFLAVAQLSHTLTKVCEEKLDPNIHIFGAATETCV